MVKIPDGYRKKWKAKKRKKPSAEPKEKAEYRCIACNNTRKNSVGGFCWPCMNRGLISPR